MNMQTNAILRSPVTCSWGDVCHKPRTFTRSSSGNSVKIKKCLYRCLLVLLLRVHVNGLIHLHKNKRNPPIWFEWRKQTSKTGIQEANNTYRSQRILFCSSPVLTESWNWSCTSAVLKLASMLKENCPSYSWQPLSNPPLFKPLDNSSTVPDLPHKNCQCRQAGWKDFKKLYGDLNDGFR